MAFHLTELKQAKNTLRTNIDEWYEKLQNSHNKLLINSSGCSSFIKQYGTIMQDDSVYAAKAKFVSENCIDLAELATSIKLHTTRHKDKTVQREI